MDDLTSLTDILDLDLVEGTFELKSVNISLKIS